MRKNKTTAYDYIMIRSEQLREDRDKAADPMDKQWYNRVIEELNWVSMYIAEPDSKLPERQATETYYTERDWARTVGYGSVPTKYKKPEKNS